MKIIHLSIIINLEQGFLISLHSILLMRTASSTPLNRKFLHSFLPSSATQLHSKNILRSRLHPCLSASLSRASYPPSILFTIFYHSINTPRSLPFYLQHNYLHTSKLEYSIFQIPTFYLTSILLHICSLILYFHKLPNHS